MAEPGQGQGQGVLGHRLGVGALGARPGVVVIDEPEGQDLLHPGEGQLHPAETRGRRHLVGEALHVGRIQPHQGFGPLADVDQRAASGGHGIGGE